MHPLRSLATVVVTAALAATTGPACAHATDPSTRPPSPPMGHWWDGHVYEITHGGAGIPGLDDDSCVPTPAHPEPVILLHGTGGTGGDFTAYAAALLDAGYCVWSPTYGAAGPQIAGRSLVGGTTTIEHGAGPEVAGTIDRILADTGARKVDLVGISLGGAVAGYVAKVLRPQQVRTVVGVSAFWGTGLALPGEDSPLTMAFRMSSDISPFPSQREMTPGSDLERRWLGPENSVFAEGVRYRSVWSRTDGLLPESLAALDDPHLERIAVQDGCPVDRSSHLTMIVDPRAIDLTMHALDPADPRPLRCVPTDGLIGPTP